jgi:hypothetical protein
MENNSPTWTVDVLQLGRDAWARRDVLFITTAAVFVFAVILLHFVRPSYTVSLSVAPVSQNSAQLGGGLDALAKLGGIDIGGAGDTVQFQLFITGLTSRDAANQVALDQPLMRQLFPEQWSQEDQEWKAPHGLVHFLATAVKEAIGIPVVPWAPPSGSDVQTFLTDHLEVDYNPKSPAVALRLQSEHPKAILELMRRLVSIVDTQIRESALQRANDYIAYLKPRIDQERVVEYKAALLNQLAMQEHTRMMASAHVPFAMQIFSQPAVSKRPTAPKTIPLLILALFAGVGLGVLLAIRAFRTGSPRLIGWRGRIGREAEMVSQDRVGF